MRLTLDPISWKSHIQREVILSTTEVDYLVAIETCRQLQWIKLPLAELKIVVLVKGAGRTNLYLDNQSTISLIKKDDNNRRSKHITLLNF